MMFSRAIVRPPAANFSQGLASTGLGAPDYERALEQHEAYCAALQQCGLKLTRLKSDPDFPDSSFVEDTAVLTERCAMLARPGAKSRRGEVESMRDALSKFYSDSAIRTIEFDGTLDGGDVCQAESHFFIGISGRTNEAGARQLAESLTRFGYTSSFVNIGNVNGPLHLKSAVAYLGDNRLVVTDALAEHRDFAGYELVHVNLAEEYAANCVRLNDYVLIAAGYPTFEASLREPNYQTIALEMSEFQKMDGGLSCLSLRF